MRRVAAGAVAVTMLAVPGAVIAGDIEAGDFGGKVDGDPDQYITFDVVKRNGKRFVTHIAEINAPFTCEDPIGNGPQSGTLDGRFRIKNGEFSGRKSYDFTGMRRGGSSGIAYSIKGEFVTKRKVVGNYRMRLRGGPPNPCVTGKLPYVARKPAPPPPKP
jgi:hypothetical protein